LVRELTVKVDNLSEEKRRHVKVREKDDKSKAEVYGKKVRVDSDELAEEKSEQ
jgi:hypothetical protein